MSLLRNNFTAARDLGDLNSMNKYSSRFYRLELLIAKIVRALSMGNSLRFVYLVKIWSVLDGAESFKILGLLEAYGNSVEVFKQFLVAKKHYCKTKYIKSELAKSVSINKVIGKYMDDFVLEKKNMISSILECLFHKIVFDYLVLDGDLILELAEVKAKTKKCRVPDLWSHQYASLNYAIDNAFSGVMNEIGLRDLHAVVKNLLDGKAAGLSGVSNKLWKHSDDLVLGCLLDLLNSCLVHGNIPALWKCA
ncbi:hypothetical protein G9A89_004865 [Geosiphon pyriformis]|nr:hypothetical protein G9A89_004865 [Geosiphon pyriformis]